MRAFKGIFAATLTLCFTISVSAQPFTKIKTADLLNAAGTADSAFHDSYELQKLNYALPLIDSPVAVKLALLHVNDKVTNSSVYGYSNFFLAIAFQCKNNALKDEVVRSFQPYECKCADSVTRQYVNESEYMYSQRINYEYPKILKSALNKQMQLNDSTVLKKAMAGFTYWGDWAWAYNDTILKPGVKQLSMAKRKFDPCLFAGAVNGNFWRSCIYAMTNKEEFGSSDDKLNEAYRKNLKSIHAIKDSDDLKDLVRIEKTRSYTLTMPCNSLDTLDFSKEPELKEKLDEIEKKDSWKIILYTNQKKALLYNSYLEKIPKTWTSAGGFLTTSSVYLVQLTSPTTVEFNKINYRTRYFY